MTLKHATAPFQKNYDHEISTSGRLKTTVKTNLKDDHNVINARSPGLGKTLFGEKFG